MFIGTRHLIPTFLAQTLKLWILAEGVETDAQMAFLRQAHCEEAQGYRFSKPVSPGEVPLLLQKRRPWNHA